MGFERSKELPFLREYLEHTASRKAPDASVAILAGIGAVFGTVAMFLLVSNLAPLWVAIPVMLAIGLPVLAVVGKGVASQIQKSKSPEALRTDKLQAAATKMLALKRKQLGRALGTAAASLLEEAARYHNRAHACLNGPFWSNPNLPAHWKVAREQALASADEGMGDLILISENLMTPTKPNPEWQEIVGEVFGDLFGNQKADSFSEGIRPEYEPARAIAERLKLLASEVENATMMVIKDQSNAESFSSVSSLETALSEIRQVQKAETEARQDLGQF